MVKQQWENNYNNCSRYRSFFEKEWTRVESWCSIEFELWSLIDSILMKIRAVTNSWEHRGVKAEVFVDARAKRKQTSNPLCAFTSRAPRARVTKIAPFIAGESITAHENWCTNKNSPTMGSIIWPLIESANFHWLCRKWTRFQTLW